MGPLLPARAIARSTSTSAGCARSSAVRSRDAGSSTPTPASATASRRRREPQGAAWSAFTSFLQARHTPVTRCGRAAERLPGVNGSRAQTARYPPRQTTKENDLMSRKLLPALAASAVLALGVAACGGSDDSADASGDGASGTIAGAGSSAQQAAQEAWIAQFENDNSGATISYDAIGSGGGRDQFIAGGKTAYAGSDAAFDEEELPRLSSAARARAASWSRSRPTSRRWRSSTTCRGSTTSSWPPRRPRRSSRARSPSGTIPRSRRTTQASICLTRTSRLSTAPTSPERRSTSRTICMRPRRASGPLTPTAIGR